jgi:uncharacterized protein YjhX (UPF0386 family)
LNISKAEQRVLHALAQGGRIRHVRDATGRISEIFCLTREGHRMLACDLALFARLKRRRFIGSVQGQPYSITKQGLVAVRAQLNQR